MRIEYHRTLIADQVRVAAFQEALARTIRPGESVVVDIGTGSGLLAFIAAKLGARRVYAYEMAEIGAVAERVKRLNRLRNVELIPGRSTDMIDPPRGDIVVSETLGNMAFEESLIETMIDARARHVKKGGILVPGRVRQFVAPVISPRLHAELTAWDRLGHDLDFGPARDMSLNNVYVRQIAPAELLEGGRSAVCWDDVDLAAVKSSTRRGQARWTIASAVTVYGFAVWWAAELLPALTLATDPRGPATHWEQLYFPMLAPVPLAPGESLGAEIRTTTSEARGTDMSWSVTVQAASGKQRSRQSMSLEKGYIP